DRVGLGHRLRHKPRELSGGEMQRAAIARALVNQPRILLADEPTGNLDQGNGEEIIRLLRDLNQQDGLTIVMVTHNMDIVSTTDRVVKLVGGRVEEPDVRAHHPSAVPGIHPALLTPALPGASRDVSASAWRRAE